jgi:hypothetical protein
MMRFKPRVCAGCATTRFEARGLTQKMATAFSAKHPFEKETYSFHEHPLRHGALFNSVNFRLRLSMFASATCGAGEGPAPCDASVVRPNDAASADSCQLGPPAPADRRAAARFEIITQVC